MVKTQLICPSIYIIILYDDDRFGTRNEDIYYILLENVVHNIGGMCNHYYCSYRAVAAAVLGRPLFELITIIAYDFPT